MKEKTMQEVLRENKENYRRKLEQQRKQAKIENIKEWILFSIIATFILTISFILLNNMTEKNINNCQLLGYDKNVCEFNLR